MKKIFFYLLPIVLASFLLYHRTHLWSWDMRVPLGYQGDGLFGLMFIKCLVEEGWIFTNHSLGAPGILFLHDYPQSGDSFYYVLMKLMSWICSDPFIILNAFYIIRFPLTALVATRVFEKLGISYWSAAAFGTIYAFIPTNIARGQGHLMLGTYFTLPCIIYVVLKVMDGGYSLRWRSREFILASVVCMMIAGSGVYYSFFACTFLALASVSIFFSAETHAVRKSLSGFFFTIVIVVSSIAYSIPVFLYHREMGKNLMVAQRAPWESEIYGMKIIQLIVPISNHVFELFRKITARYVRGNPLITENIMVALGLTGAIGFTALIVWMFLRSFEGMQFKKLTKFLFLQDTDVRLISHLSLLNMWAVLLATIGGMGSIIAFTLLPAVRCYNRISIYIAFFALAMVALLIDRWFLRLKKRFRCIGILFLGGLVWLAVLDQVGLIGYPPEATAVEFNSDRQFFNRIELRIPENSMIFQLPYIPFPEFPTVHKMMDYEHFKAYLHSKKGTRWSYGAINGRSTSQWIRETVSMPPKDMIKRLEGRGFVGIYIDRFGYEDEGREIEGKLQKLLKSKPIVSQDNRRVYYSLSFNSSGIRSPLPLH